MFDNSEYFETILNCGTLSKAAIRLGISQPALSNYLRQLEAKVGVVLLDRSVSPITLTDAGKVFYRYMKQSDAVRENFLNEIGDLENNRSGTITIGGASSTTACYLSRVASDFLRKYPESNVRILDGVVADITRRALNNEVDFFISPESQQNAEFKYVKLLDERLFMCVPENIVHAIGARSAAAAKELEGAAIPIEKLLAGELREGTYRAIPGKLFENSRFILLEEQTNVWNFTNTLFETWGFAPVNPIEVSQMLTGFQLCVNGAGITFLPESILRFGSFKEYPMIYAVDERMSHRSMYACVRKNRYMSMLCSDFIEMLKDTLQQA